MFYEAEWGRFMCLVIRLISSLNWYVVLALNVNAIVEFGIAALQHIYFLQTNTGIYYINIWQENASQRHNLYNWKL